MRQLDPDRSRVRRVPVEVEVGPHDLGNWTWRRESMSVPSSDQDEDGLRWLQPGDRVPLRVDVRDRDPVSWGKLRIIFKLKNKIKVNLSCENRETILLLEHKF